MFEVVNEERVTKNKYPYANWWAKPYNTILKEHALLTGLPQIYNFLEYDYTETNTTYRRYAHLQNTTLLLWLQILNNLS